MVSKICIGCMEPYGDEFNICLHRGYFEGTKPENALHIEPGNILQPLLFPMSRNEITIE